MPSSSFTNQPSSPSLRVQVNSRLLRHLFTKPGLYRKCGRRYILQGTYIKVIELGESPQFLQSTLFTVNMGWKPI
uniref:Uncharacterized protein n=1 Tax=Arundo donax TaxID=35708 RepID=A0A0A8Z1N8_ARUDO